MSAKDESYHQSAILYNEELATFADDLAGKIESEEVARWSRSVAKQHRFHAGRHKKALDKIRKSLAKTVNTEDGGEDVVIDENVNSSAPAQESTLAKQDASPTDTPAPTDNQPKPTAPTAPQFASATVPSE